MMFHNCRINNYLITSQIGEGAYGLVYRALDIRTDRQYAIKAVVQSYDVSKEADMGNDKIHKNSVKLQKKLAKLFKESKNVVRVPSIDLESIENMSEEDFKKLPHYKEISLHLRVHHHKNIVTIHEVLQSAVCTFIVMDYYPTDLFTSIVDNRHFVTNGLLVKRFFYRSVLLLIIAMSTASTTVTSSLKTCYWIQKITFSYAILVYPLLPHI